MTERLIQQGMLALASHSSWSIESMLDLPFSTFIEFIELLPKKEK